MCPLLCKSSELILKNNQHNKEKQLDIINSIRRDEEKLELEDFECVIDEGDNKINFFISRLCESEAKDGQNQKVMINFIPFIGISSWEIEDN